MKTINFFLLPAFIVFTSFFSAVSAANAGVTPTVALEADPPKKKCRKCAPWRPDRLFKKGQFDAVFGLGLVPTFQADGAKTNLLPLSVGVEYRFSEKFSLGASTSHSISESKPRMIYDGSEASWKNSFYQVALRPAFHVNQIEDWDFYGGFSIGMNMSVIEGHSNNTETDMREIEHHLGISRHRTSLAYTGFAGVRYVLLPNWAVGCEVGFGVSMITVGVNYLLKG